MSTETSTSKRTLRQEKIGEVFDRLTIIGKESIALTASTRIARSGNRIAAGARTVWICRCECGTIARVRSYHLKSGNTRSCGCLEREKLSARSAKHGGKRSPEYMVWCGLKARCYDSKREQFKDYGGRGIKVCDRWLHDFSAFLADMGTRPTPKHSLDRFPDTNGDYEPGNCRWATRPQQARNTRSNVVISFGGETKTLVEWAEDLGINYYTLQARIKKRKWPIEKAFTIAAKPAPRSPR
jgi:hypothetical protein